MLAKPIGLEEISVFGGLPARIALIAGLALALSPIAVRAQVNIDAGKTPAEIYASDCATCHKTPRGLAAGKNSLMLSSFLREHYTASRDQASALAAYVLGAGGAEAAPKQKPEVEHARAEEPPKTGEIKPGEPRGGQPKLGEAKPGQPKTAARPVRAAAKPEEKRANEEDVKQEQHPAPVSEDHAVSETANRESKQEPEEAAPAVHRPAAIVSAPAKDQTPAPLTASDAPSSAQPVQARSESDLPSLELGSSLNAIPPAEDRSSAVETAPRDHIPD